VKLLLDQNLSYRLISLPGDLFPESSHVARHDLERAEDFVVWEFARDNGFIAVSKDSDLNKIGMIHGFPPYQVWIRRGNCSTAEIEALLRTNAEDIRKLPNSESGGILELY